MSCTKGRKNKTRWVVWWSSWMWVSSECMCVTIVPLGVKTTCASCLLNEGSKKGETVRVPEANCVPSSSNAKPIFQSGTSRRTVLWERMRKRVHNESSRKKRSHLQCELLMEFCGAACQRFDAVVPKGNDDAVVFRALLLRWPFRLFKALHCSENREQIVSLPDY